MSDRGNVRINGDNGIEVSLSGDGTLTLRRSGYHAFSGSAELGEEDMRDLAAALTFKAVEAARVLNVKTVGKRSVLEELVAAQQWSNLVLGALVEAYEALEFYADKENWINTTGEIRVAPMNIDIGERARTCLAEAPIELGEQ